MRLRRKEAIAFALLGVAAIAVLVPWGDDEPDPAPKEPTPHAGEPEPGEPQPAEPAPEDPQPGEPQPGDPQPGDPQPGDPQPGDPQPGDPQPGDPQPGDPEPEDPEARRARLEAERRARETEALIEVARKTLDARRAIAVLEGADAELVEQPLLQSTLAGLRAEIASLNTVPSPRHPSIEQVQRDLEAVEAARARIPALREANADVDAVADLLMEILADTAIRSFTDAFFAPVLPDDVSLEEDALAALPVDGATGVLGRALPELSAARLKTLGIALADRFIAQDRGRARIRWLLPVWRRHATDPAITEALARAWLAQNRVFAAQLTLRTGPATGSLDYLRLRAVVSGYASAPQDEAAAWEALGTRHMNRQELDRLLELYKVTGAPQKAYELTRELLRANPNRERTEDAIVRALGIGEIDDALDLVNEATRLYPPARYWLEWGYEISVRDLRTDDAMQYLEQLFQLFPTGSFERQGQTGAYWEKLEQLYIRRRMDLRRTALLETRLERITDDREKTGIRQQLITLYLVLEDEDAARLHLRDAVAEAPTVKAMMPLLGDALGLNALAAIAEARRRLLTEDFSEGDSINLYDTLQPRIPQDEQRAVLETLFRRLPESEEIRERLLLVLDAVDPRAAAALEEERALAHPDNEEYVRAWVLRAGWTQDIDWMIRARQALAQVAPGDVDNRRLLAQLYSGKQDEQAALLQWIAIHESGSGTTQDYNNLIDTLLFTRDYTLATRYMRERLAAVPDDRRTKFQLADVLFQAGEKEEAIAMLRELATHPDATRAEKMAFGSALLGEGLHEEAVKLYRGMVQKDPQDLEAKLKLAQSFAWSARPRESEPILSEIIRDNPSGESQQADRVLAEARFTRSEVWRALERKQAAEHETRMAERALRSIEDPSIIHRVMHGKVLARLGRTRESEEIFEAVKATAPKEVQLVLDHADARMSAKRWVAARSMLESARRISPNSRRLERMDASLRIPEKRYESSARMLRSLMRDSEPSTLDHAEYGTALRESGRTRAAEVAFASALRKDIERKWFYDAWRELHFEAGPTLGTYGETRLSGDDRLSRVGLRGHTILPGDRWRVAADVAWVQARGAANLPDERRLREEFLTADAELAYRFCRKCWAFVGISGFLLNDEGDFPVGGRLGVRMRGADPYQNIEAQIHVNEMLDEVAAGPALGGRKDGFRVEAYREVMTCGWVSGLASIDRFRIDVPGRGEVADGWLQWQIEGGWRLIGQEKGLSVRGTYSGSRLLDDRALAEVIPLGKRFDRLTGGIRLTWSWRQVMDAVVEVYAGTDAASSGSVWGVEGSATLWPHRDLRVRIRAGYGNQDKFQDGEFGHIGLALDARF